MKKLFSLFSISAFLLLTAAAHSATISGKITVAGTMAAASNVKVHVTDSAGTYIYADSAVTNASGNYSITLPAGVLPGHWLTIWITDPAWNSGTYITGCNYTYNGISFTEDFQTFRSAPTGKYLATSAHVPGATGQTCAATYYLISKAYDPVVADTVLTAIDSFSFASDFNATVHRYYPSGASGSLYLKAALQPADVSYSTGIPTYYDTSLQWSGAVQITTNQLNAMGQAGVSFRVGVNPGGPGFIGGSVLLGANKNNGAGDPLANRIILLTNAATGKPVSYTYSNASGQFSFSNLAYGTYKLFGDVWGKKNPALIVTISSANGSVSNVLFKENRKDFTGQIGGLGVSGANPLLAGISAYPNPASDYIEVGGLSTIPGNKTISMTSANGAVIMSRIVPAGQGTRIAASALASGVYIISVQTGSGTVHMKIIK